MNEKEKEVYIKICKYDKEPKEVIVELQNIIEKQQRELDKKDKIIDLMVGNVFLMNGDRGCTKQEKIEYFTKKASEE